MNKICDDDICTGCGLCVAKCPKSAISLDIVGLHYHPVINPKECVDCGACERICPNKSHIELKDNLACYASWSIDELDHFESASGGLATTLGKKFIQDGGFVAGCAWNKNFRATTIVTNDLTQLERFRKSKYVHNYFPKSSYQKILELLKNEEKVLFVGVPCQCEALKRYVGVERSKNLYLVDILCHGAASPKLFDDYIASIKKQNKIYDITFRGGKYDCKLCIWKSDEDLLYMGEQFEDPYFWSFMRRTTYRKSCLCCSFATEKRVGDLTLADFWGLNKEIVDANDLLRRGVSLVLEHTEKGKNLLSLIKNDVVLLERPVEEAIKGNDTLRKPTPKPFQYDFLNMVFRCVGVKKGVLFDLLYLRKSLIPMLKSCIRSMLPEVIVKTIKGKKK